MLPIVDNDTRWADRTRNTVQRLDAVESRMAAFRKGFAPGSAAAHDAERAAGYYAWSFAAAGIQVAHDHLRALRFLLAAAPQLPFAHWTLIRAAVEGSAVARWICAAPSAEIPGRGVGAQLRDYEERQGFEGRLRSAMPSVSGPTVDAALRGAGQESTVDHRQVAPAP